MAMAHSATATVASTLRRPVQITYTTTHVSAIAYIQ